MRTRVRRPHRSNITVLYIDTIYRRDYNIIRTIYENTIYNVKSSFKAYRGGGGRRRDD